MAPSAASQQLSVAKSNREKYFQRVQRCYDLVNKKDQTRVFIERSKQLTETYQKFEEVSDRIEQLNTQLASDESPLEVTKVFQAFDEMYFQVKAYETTLREEAAMASSANAASQPSTATQQPKEEQVKLPTIQIPVFSGQITDFPAWKSLYMELIHNSNLSSIQKFTYLRSYLSGQALSTIEGIVFCAQNYILAFNTLTERYSNKRLLAKHHFNTLLHFQPLESDNISGLRAFLDSFNIPVQSLKGLNIPNLDDFILLQLALKVLDPKSNREFETEQNQQSIPTFANLVDFVKKKCAILEMLNESKGESLKSSKNKHQAKSLVTSVELVSKGNKLPTNCSLCKQGFHKISICPKFVNMETSKRFSVIKDRRMCFACFGTDHSSNECQSTYRCRTCGSASHHTMLHPNQGKSSVQYAGKGSSTHPATNSNKPSASQVVHSGVTHTAASPQVNPQTVGEGPILNGSSVLLGTATVQVQNSLGDWVSVSCVIDPGSQISAVSESLAQVLGLVRKKSSLQVSGIGSAGIIKSKGMISCEVLPHSKLAGGVEPLKVEAVVLPTIASNITTKLPVNVLKEFQHIHLADLSYHTSEAPASIDMLLGAEYYTSIVISSLPIIQGSPAAIPSRFGWLLMGRVCDDNMDAPVTSTSLFISSLQDPIATELQRFWEIEELPNSESTSDPDDLFCENHFLQTYSRDSSGSYIVKLPFKNGEYPNLTSNRAIAYKRMDNLTRKLNHNPELKKLYLENLNSYLEVGHMSLAKEPSPYLLIHHGVYKESSSTPLRVVFDPNISVGKQPSLASSLLIGPKLQKDISDILVQFRLNKVALLCDIKGMYRCIWLAEEDCKFQHILWYNENGNIKEFELKTVTFGLPPSPFLAQRVLKQLAIDEGVNFPSAARTLNSDVYVDDVVTGADSVASAQSLQRELTDLLGQGGFLLRKWASSHPEALVNISEECCEKPHKLGGDESIKVLGIQWSPKIDSFSYAISVQQEPSITKRKVLSIIASIYDVNGFLSPVTVWLKIFLQQIWLHKNISWDTKLPPPLQEKWNSFISEAPLMEQIRVPRHIPIEGCRSVELIGMSDGSSVAYSAVMYLRVTSEQGAVSVHLIRARTKVMPLKPITINRGELCGALLLARVLNSLSFLHSKIEIRNIYLFSDSSTVLAWLTTPPHSLKIFVANRVVKILELTKNASWHHVSSANNSADSASRGMLPSQFMENSRLWFHGPEFLTSCVEEWPQGVGGKNIEPLPELKTSHVLLTKSKEQPFFIGLMEKFSSLSKLQAVIGWVCRFIYNLKNPDKKQTGQLSVQELRQALTKCVGLCQSVYLQEDISNIKLGKVYSSGLRPLSPFLNSSGVLLVGGRLANAPIPEEVKHPMILPKCHLAVLIVWHYHQITIHGGPRIVLSLIQQRYWIIGGRNLVRHQLNKCVTCVRSRPKLTQPYMADLPSSRFEQGRPFLNTGVDYAGPFSYKTGPRRNSPLDKCYLALFICMATKCVHLELVSSLSTPAFIATLDRFVGRRGLPKCIYSDNGTNFRGTASYLKEVQKFLRDSNEDIITHLRKQEIQWCFIPPNSPNFGGLWEAGVKSTKYHLKRALNGLNLNFEEFTTLLVRIEAILNSRPLFCYNSSPDEGVAVLTPGHFLVGAPLLARPEQQDGNDISTLKRWKLISQANQTFWKLWSRDYLNTLMQRTKWTDHNSNIQTGDVVIVANELFAPQRWPLAKVVEILPGKDGVVRVAKVKTAAGEFLRPVSKLVKLLSQEN